MLFHVQWTNSSGVKKHKYFTMKPLIKSGNSYQESYEICFKAAIKFNSNLIV